jgi:hypothetical protein
MARNLNQLREEIAKAKQHFGLPAEAAVRSCYEAGRDGFWLHRALTAMGITNVVVDSGGEACRSGHLGGPLANDSPVPPNA